MGLCVLLLAPHLVAQPLDLGTAYELGLKNDRRLQAARARTAGELELPKMAQSRLLPSVSLSLSRGEVQQDRSDAASIALKQRYASEQQVLGLRQPLYAPRLQHAVAQAQAQALAAEADLRGEFVLLLMRVSEAYFNAVLALEKSGQLEQLSALATARLRAAERAFQAGTGTRTDIMDVRAEADVLASQIIQARQAQSVAEGDLASMLGLASARPLSLPAAFSSASALHLDDLSALLPRLLSSHPEIAQRLHQVEAADKNLRAAQSDHRPTADLVLQRSRSVGENSFYTASRLETQTASVQVQVPIYQGGYVDARIRQALAGRQEAEQRLNEARDRLQNELRRAVASFQEQASRLQALGTALESAQLTVQANQRSAEVGVRSQLDVMVAEQRVAQVRLLLAEARVQMLQAWIKARAWTGEDLAAVLRETTPWFTPLAR